MEWHTVILPTTKWHGMAWHGIEWYDMVWYGIFLVDILKKMQLEKKHIHVHN